MNPRDRSFRHWTIGAALAAITFTCSLWWAGNDNGIESVCSALNAQPLAYCSRNHAAHLWWLLTVLASGVYLGFYIARVRKLLRIATSERKPADGSMTLRSHPQQHRRSDATPGDGEQNNQK